MADMNLGVQLEVNTRNNQGWKLGATNSKFSDADINKAVVLDTANEGVLKLAADGEEIRGFVQSIEPTTSDGYTFGTVVVHAPGVRMWVTGRGLVIGDLVVAGTQNNPRTNNPGIGMNPNNSRGLTQVKKGEPTTFKWQVIRAVGTNKFLIEAI